MCLTVATVTDDITDLTSAAFLNEVGKKSKVFMRFSTVGGEQGSADTARDPRGVAIKIYTEEGNEDWVFNNTPIFFVRDPTKFPLFIHTQKRDPQTHLKNATMFWDYLSTNQESINQLMRLFSDRGTPYGFRNINAHSGHVCFRPSQLYRQTLTVLADLQVRQGRRFLRLRQDPPDH